MNFGWDVSTPYGKDTALHEIGHALGFPHEHQNPNAGIVWDVDAVNNYFSGRQITGMKVKYFITYCGKFHLLKLMVRIGIKIPLCITSLAPGL